MPEPEVGPARRRRSRSTPASRPAGRSSDDYGAGTPGPKEDEDEAVEAHASFVERLYGGGAAADPEILDRANEVWQRLPGAVIRVAARIRTNRPGPDPRGESR